MGPVGVSASLRQVSRIGSSLRACARHTCALNAQSFMTPSTWRLRVLANWMSRVASTSAWTCCTGIPSASKILLSALPNSAGKSLFRAGRITGSKDRSLWHSTSRVGPKLSRFAYKSPSTPVDAVSGSMAVSLNRRRTRCVQRNTVIWLSKHRTSRPRNFVEDSPENGTTDGHDQEEQTERCPDCWGLRPCPIAS